jgi:hypothetical protein
MLQLNAGRSCVHTFYHKCFDNTSPFCFYILTFMFYFDVCFSVHILKFCNDKF